MKKISPQPASKNYMLGCALDNYRGVLKSFKDYKESLKMAFYDTYDDTTVTDFDRLLIHFRLVTKYFCSNLVEILLFVVYGLVVLLGYGINRIVFNVATSKERRYVRNNSISFVCPKCQTMRSMVSSFECPKCKKLHTELVPSEYGILHRKCTCGHTLPTMFLNGKSSLKALCPHCFEPVDNPKVSSDCISFIGAKTYKKTTLMESFYNSIASDNVLKVTPANEDTAEAMKDGYDAYIDTIEHNNMSIDVFIDGDKFRGVNKYLHMYTFQNDLTYHDDSNMELTFQRECSISNAIVFIIDVFTLESVYSKYGDLITDLDIKNAISFDTNYSLTLNSYIALYRRYRGIDVKNRIDTPILLYLNNMDYIPESEYRPTDSTHDSSASIEKFLNRNGLEGFMHSVHTNFKNVCIGTNLDGTKPINRLLAKTNSVY